MGGGEGVADRLLGHDDIYFHLCVAGGGSGTAEGRMQMELFGDGITALCLWVLSLIFWQQPGWLWGGGCY